MAKAYKPKMKQKSRKSILKSIKRIIGKGNDPKRKERYMTKMQELNNIDVLFFY